MTRELTVYHGFIVLAGKLEDVGDSLAAWKRTELEKKLAECWDIVERNDRRKKDRRK